MRLRHAMVCSSNNNRSMEAHALMKRQGFDVSSYGTGAHVKLPGPSLREPNVYDFGTPYRHMYDDLRRKDPDLYNRNGILPMLKRNATVKAAPQRWQDNAADGCFDVVFTFEERVFDMVLEGDSSAPKAASVPSDVGLLVQQHIAVYYALNRLSFSIASYKAPTRSSYMHNREHALMKTVLIVNLDVKDNHEEAAIGAKLALDLCQEIEAVDCWEDSIDEIVAAFERLHKRKVLYSVSFY